MPLSAVEQRRLDLYLTRTGAARKAGVSQSTMYAVERLGRIPSPELRAAIAQALDTIEAELWPDADQ